MEDNTTLAVIVTSAISGVIGYGLRTMWDSYVKHQDTLRTETWKIRANQLERRLSQFYWPIYLRLQRDNVVWEKILDRFQSENEERRKLAFEIEKTVIIPNHLEIVRAIQSAIHLANVDKELEPVLMAYLRHIDVYTSIRSAGIHDKDPIAFGEPWPRDLFEVIRRRLVRYQAEYDELLRDQGILALGGAAPSHQLVSEAPNRLENRP